MGLSPEVLQLMTGANRGDAAMVREALSKGAAVDARDNGGKTALMRAAQDGYSDVLKLLLEHGADIHAIDPEGRTALTYAIGQSGSAASVELLFAAGGKYEPRRISWTTVGQPAFSHGIDGGPPIRKIVERWVQVERDPAVPPMDIEGMLSQGIGQVVGSFHGLTLLSAEQALVAGLHDFMDLLLNDGLEQCLWNGDLLHILKGFKKIGATQAETTLEAALRAAHDGRLPEHGRDLHENESVLSKLLEAESSLSDCFEEVNERLAEYVKGNISALRDTYAYVTRAKPLDA